jgi:hypothetical protein
MNGSPAPASGPGTPLWCGLLGLFQPILFPFSVPGSASAGIERAVSTAEATINFFNFVSLTLSFPTPREVYTELDLGCRARRLLFNSRLLAVVLDRRKKSHKASSLPIRYAVIQYCVRFSSSGRCWRRGGERFRPFDFFSGPLYWM